jgi:hypothetical protein
MTVQEGNQSQHDLSLLAIEAAEELERFRKKLTTDFKAVNALSLILRESFSKHVDQSDLDFRLDHASVFSKAISNSFGSTIKKRSISELANEAIEVASRLNFDSINSKDEELKLLVSFCVALSDSAALYKEELDELNKSFAA